MKAFICNGISGGIIVALLSGCATNKPFSVSWERAGLDRFSGKVQSSLQAASPVSTASPIASISKDQRLYLASRAGGIMSLELPYAKPVWRIDAEAVFEASGLVAGELFFIGDLDGRMHAINRTTGVTLWIYQAEGEILAAPVLDDDKLIFSTAMNMVFAVHATTGELLWRYREDPPTGVSMRGISAPLIDAANRQVLIGFSQGDVVALNIGSGQATWRIKVGIDRNYLDVDGTPVLVGDQLIVATVSGPLASYAVKAQGKLKWFNEKIRTPVSVLAVDDKIYVAALDGKLYALQNQDGKVLWETTFAEENTAPSAPQLIENQIVFGASNGRIYVVDSNSGALLWQYKIGARVSGNIVPLSDGFLVMDGGQRLFRFRRN